MVHIYTNCHLQHHLAQMLNKPQYKYKIINFKISHADQCPRHKQHIVNIKLAISCIINHIAISKLGNITRDQANWTLKKDKCI